MSPTQRLGMVDRLELPSSGPTAAEIEFVTAYLQEGPMDPALLARAFDPARQAERETRVAELRQRDWPNLGQYRQANADLAAPPRCVFLGDSLTEAWPAADPELFSNGVVGRGISGQTSPQILLRFMADVVALKPMAVHILCGGNDIAGNTGPITFADYQNNITAMVLLAEANGLKVVIGGHPPYSQISWAPEIDPRPWVRPMNAWLQDLARSRGHAFADYYAALDQGDGSMAADQARDGVHPTCAGYARMRPVAEAALRSALET